MTPTPDPGLIQGITVFIWVGAIGAIIFVILFAYLTDWWRTPIGRNVMSLMAILAIALSFTALYKIITIPLWISLLEVFLLAQVIWWRIAIFLKEQIAYRQAFWKLQKLK